MRLDPVSSAVRHKVGDWHSIAADDNSFAVPFQLSQQAGKVGFRLVNINRFHVRKFSPVLNVVNIVNIVTLSTVVLSS
jgi:hypothetical protein